MNKKFIPVSVVQEVRQAKPSCYKNLLVEEELQI